MTKEIIIIALIVIIIYLAYQQNQPNISDNSQLEQLKNELKHFQTLYEDRINKDLGYEDSEVIYDSEKEILQTQINNLTTKLAQETEEIKSLNLSKQDLLKTISQKEQELLSVESNQQEQLRKINLLFDDKANSYESIDFKVLYSLLESIAEREGERAKIECREVESETKPLSHKAQRKLKKRK